MAADESHDDRTQSFVALTKGTMVSHYRIVEKIGAGGMGEVYLAEDTDLKRFVAIKFMPSHTASNADMRARFTREARAVAALNHPNIVTIFEVGEFSGRPFFAMEHVPGETLRAVIKQGKLSTEEAVRLTMQICEGLHEAHSAGVVHRDIKPGNIIIDTKGRARLLDFGLAMVSGEDKLTKTGSTLGTAGYMSPEQVGGKTVDYRSDLFSVGVILYEMLTGRRPFDSDNDAAIVNAITNSTPEPVARFKSGVTGELQQIVDKALTKDPSLRYQHADGMLTDLRRLSIEPVPRKKGKLTPILISLLIVIPVVAVLVLKPWRFEIQSSDEAVASGNRLAIMYFDNLADPNDSLRLGEITTNLLITDLSESQFVQVVSSQRLYDILKTLGREGEKKIDRGVASQIAERASAKWMLHGSILRTDPLIVITAQLIDVVSGTSVATQRINGGPGEDIFALVDKLTIEIKNDLSLPEEALNEPDQPVANVTTDSPEAYRYYLEGVENTRKVYTADAISSFRKALEYDSTFAMAYFWLAKYTSGEKQEKMITQMVKYSDNVNKKEKQYIEILALDNDADEVEELKKLIERYPEDKLAWLWLGFLYRKSGNQEEAVVCLEKVIELDPLFKMAYNSLAYAYDDLGDFDKSIGAINKYIEIAPDEANPYDTRADIYAFNGKLDKAIESYKKALETKTDFYRSWNSLGFMYIFKKQYSEAERCFDKMIGSSLTATRSRGRLELALIPLHQGKFKEALEVIDQGIAADRIEKAESWEKYLLKAGIFIEQNEVQQELAKAVENSKAKHSPVNPFYDMQVLGVAKNGNFEEAENMLSQWKNEIAQQDRPNPVMMGYYWLGVGCVAQAKEDYESAIVSFIKAIEVLPSASNPPGFRARFLLSRAYQESGDLARATSGFEELISIYSGGRLRVCILSVKLHYYLGQVYETSGWNEKAIEQYETFLDIWKNADEGLKSIDDAKIRLAKLKAPM